MFIFSIKKYELGAEGVHFKWTSGKTTPGRPVPLCHHKLIFSNSLILHNVEVVPVGKELQGTAVILLRQQREGRGEHIFGT